MRKKRKLTMPDLDAVVLLYGECFCDDLYYLRHSINVPEECVDSIKMCLYSDFSYGCFEDERLVGFFLSFDYAVTKVEHPKLFEHTFGVLTLSDGSKLVPNQTTIHNVVTGLCEKGRVFYLLAYGVSNEYRKQGILTEFLCDFIDEHKTDIFVSDVSNKDPMSMYERMGFELKELETDYYFMYKI